ncbi:PocR ligand-binding domain-containing protein [Desulfosporosinus metallidurans]|uniref:Response regulator containing CheY-like receiver domain and AraC-type DNA-binding domain n=1 Tax=Desulfosporosinus metallidurans TaxID=1888891 RepID=A0A1Q8QG43_9FIRM|nr:PocR ligand-binding domain-containing protein [Desulfosporosinus metallidurans]OLN26317.1 Response regulator containing CheY-like receiver domain and AraC-type DNA-binding domain [Desulfosporosinus metallidurans]
MQRETLDSNFLDPNYLEESLGSFHNATGLHIEAINTEGVTFSVPGNFERSEFCRYIRCQPEGEKKCQDSYKRASFEAAKWEEPYFFRCHAGLVIWAVPIMIKGDSLGSIICGQVLMWEPDHFFFQELKKLNIGVQNFEELKNKACKLEVISPARSQAAADMLFVVVNHIVKRNINSLEEIDATRVQQQQIRLEIEDRKKRRLPDLSDYDTYLKKERKFLRYIRLGDRTRANQTLQSLLTDLYTKTVGDLETVKARILELATLTSRAAVEGGANAERIMHLLKEFNKEIEGIERVEKFFYKIQRIVETFLEGIFTLANKKHLAIVKDARDFIMENYALPITVTNVAQHLFISPSHLSRLFREELDCTINDYLTRVRVEQAVEIMKKPEFSVAQVSKAVGFQNQSYFAKVFRKYIGVTPLIYKNSLY